MFIPLVDILRCVNAHDETWLVASIERADERDIKSGMLGCPVCAAEYPIRDGVVVFDDGVVRTPYRAPDEREAIRLAASLDLTEARTTAVLVGEWGAHAPMIRALSPSQLLLVNPPAGVVSGDGVSIVLVSLSARAPLAVASVHAVAYDAGAHGEMIASLLQALRGGGRVVAPASSSVPAGLMELARDDDVWVAMRDAAETTSAPIGISMKKDKTDSV